MQRILQTRFTRRAGGAAAAAVALPLLAGAQLAQAAPSAAPNLRAGAVYTLTNASSGNSVAVYYRAADGSLTAGPTVGTGGNGTGANLGSQGALALSKNGEWLYAVNAGSNTISVLRVTNAGLTLAQQISSGGTTPISLSVHGHLLYVLNAGSGDITGFTVGPKGTLTMLSGSTMPVPDGGSGSAPAQVSFTPDGKVLVVTEKSAGRIATYVVDHDGRPGPALNPTHPSAGATPFGFAFARHDTLVVSQASGGAASYAVDDNGVVHDHNGTVLDGQNAACWAVATENGKYAYVANAASGNISGYRVDEQGNIALLTPGGVTGVTGAGTHPADEAMSKGSRYLYVLLNPNSFPNRIAGFIVNDDGSLQPISGLPVGGLPVGTVGLAAR